MSEDPDYEEILENNVSEAKKSIRGLENPDYRKLLQKEREGKDRKTVKEFLESRVEENDDKDVSAEEEEVVEDIEEETAGGILSGFSRGSLIATGVVVGLLVGFSVGYVGSMTGSTGTSQVAAQNAVSDLLSASGLDSSQYEFTEVTERNGMNYVSLNITQGTGNETQTSSTEFYLSPDAELLFRTQGSLGRSTVMNVQDAIQRLEQQRQLQGNGTSPQTQ